tara:strand:+ start:340 stop:2580 length:2241 start_codon:yes stop_codon:yes gene_type:complete
MPDQLQLRGGTTTEHNSFTGVSKEVTVDTTKKTLVVHDGSTAGGTPLMKESGTLDPTSISIGTGGTQKLGISNSEVVFNETGANVDFRIEGDTNTNLFKVDASSDRIGIGIATPQTLMHLHGASARFQFTDSTTGTGSGDGVITGLNGDQDFFINNRESSTNILFFTGGAALQRLHIGSTGNIGINDSTPTAELAVGAVSGNAPHIDIGHTSGNRFKLGYEGNNCFLGGSSSSSMFIFKQGVSADGHPQVDGSEVGRFDVNGRFLVGTSTPVMNESGFNEIVIAGKNEGAAMHLADNNNNVKAGLFTSDSGDGTFYIRTITANDMAFRTTNTERMRLDTSGNLTFSMEASSNYPTQQIKWSNDQTTTNGFYIAQHSDRNGRIWHEQGLSLVFGTSNQERMTILPDGHVGIGTTTPDLLGQTTDSTYLAVIETSGSRRGKLLLGDNQNADTGGIGDIHFVGHYQHSGHKEMATIKASARGSTAGQRGADLIFETKANGSSTMNECLRIGNDGRIAQKGGDLVIDNTYNGYGGLRIVDDTSADYNVNFIAGRNQSATSFVFKRSGRNAGTSPWANSGSEVEHARITRGGICFGGDSAQVNTLDDYEEGTWTPIFTDDGASGNSASSYTHQLGWYTKIGNIVNVQLRVSGANTTGMNSSHHAYIKGLPFPIKGSSNRLVTGVALLSNINLDSTTMSIGVLANVGAGSGSDNSYFRVFQVKDNTGWEPIKVSQFPSGNHEMLINLTYRAD